MVRRTRLILRLLVGTTIGLGTFSTSTAQDRGDGQSSTRISEPLRESGLDQNLTVPRGDTTVDPGAVGPQPVGSDAIPDLAIPRRGAQRPGARDDADLPQVGPDGAVPPGGLGQPSVSSPLFPEDIPSALDPSFVGAEPDLTNDQIERFKASEARLLPAVRSITDPSERALALNRIAVAKITGGRYAEAREAVDEAAQAGRAIPPGLIRDLRLIAIARTYMDLAHNRIVEAVPTIAPVNVGLQASRDIGETAAKKDEWLENAATEYARAADLIRELRNERYRSEQMASIVQAEAVDSMKIANDAARAFTTRRDLEENAPRLLAFADRLLVQADEQASRIELTVWQDQAMIVLTIAAARSNQFSRAFSVARSIPQPAARAEALMQLAESMARVSATFRVQYGESVRKSWQAILDGLDSVAALPPVIPGQPADFADTMTRQNTIDELLYDVESHDQIAQELRLLMDEILLQLRQNQRVRAQVASPLGDTRSLTADVAALGTAVDDLSRSLAELRNRVSQARGIPGGLGLGEQQPVAGDLPLRDDPLVLAIQTQNDRVLELLEDLAEPLARAATPTYSESARSVAAVTNPDPRANTAYLLVDSLTSVGRFHDARAASRLIADEDRRYVALSEIAGSMGERGLASEARAWIEREVPPNRRPLLYRSVEQGVLRSLAQLRSRSAGGFQRTSLAP